MGTAILTRTCAFLGAAISFQCHCCTGRGESNGVVDGAALVVDGRDDPVSVRMLDASNTTGGVAAAAAFASVGVISNDNSRWHQ